VFVELLADPFCAASGGLGFLAAVFDEGFAMSFLLLWRERQRLSEHIILSFAAFMPVLPPSGYPQVADG
jgi:hypothetical protein